MLHQFFLATQATPASAAAPSKQGNVACPTTCALTKTHTKCTHCSPLPSQREKLKKKHAPLIWTHMKKTVHKHCAPVTGAAARVGRASGSAAAGGRPAPNNVSAHCSHRGAVTSTTSAFAASQSASALRSSYTSWCQTLDATTSSLACTQTL